MMTFDKLQLVQEMTYRTGCLLDYPYFKDYCKMIAIDLSKQQALDTDPKAIQQINFTGNLNQRGGAKMLSIIEEVKETILNFSQRTVKVFCSGILFCFNIISI